jgi:hypothetical protein
MGNGGQAREVRGEGEDGRGGDERNKSPTMAIVALAQPIIQEITTNQQWWQPVGMGGRGGQWRGR